MEKKDRSNAWKGRGETKGRRQWTERKRWVEKKGRTQWTERKNRKRKQLKSVWFGRFAAGFCRPGIRLCPLQGRNERNIFSSFIAFTVGVGKFWIRNYHFFVDAGWFLGVYQCLPPVYSKPLALLHQISSTFGSIRIMFFSRRGEMNFII